MPLALPAGQRAGGQFEVFEIDAHAMQLVVSLRQHLIGVEPPEQAASLLQL